MDITILLEDYKGHKYGSSTGSSIAQGQKSTLQTDGGSWLFAILICSVGTVQIPKVSYIVDK